MKLKKTILAGTVAIVSAVVMSTSAFAATHNNIDTGEKLVEAFNNDTDREVIINLTGDIDKLEELKAGIGQKYTINGVDYVIKSVVIISGGGNDEENEGGVTIKTNIESEGDALRTSGNTNVTVEGNVTSEGGTGVTATDKSTVQVKGNVESEDTAVNTSGESSVKVEGDVTSTDDDAVHTDGKSNVEVTGDVTAGMDGVDANGESTVTVNGNVTADNNGINAGGTSKVDVTGNVTGGETAINAYNNTTVTVNGDVSGKDGDPKDVDYTDPIDYSDGGSGIAANDSSSVTVNGNVSGGNSYGTYGCGGEGVGAYDSSTVKVTGNVTGGNVEAEPTTKSDGDYASQAGVGVVMQNSANVTVGGDVIGGSTNGDKGEGGAGATITFIPIRSDGEEKKTNGKLYVSGIIAGGESTGTDGTSGVGVGYYIFGSDYKESFYLIPEDVEAEGEKSADIAYSLYGYSSYAIGNKLLVSLNYSEDDIKNIIDSYRNELKDLIIKTTGIQNISLDDKTKLEESLSKLDQNVQDTLNKLMFEHYNNTFRKYVEIAAQKTVDKLIGDDALVTAWSIQSGGEDVSTVTADIGGLAAQALNNKHNYLVRVNSSDNGTIEIDKQSYNPGETIIITPTPNDGYKVSSVMVNGEEITPVDGVYSYVMPEYGGVEISAEFVTIDNGGKSDSDADIDLNTDTADESATKNDTTPNTGDSSKGAMWNVVTLIASGGLISGIVALLKKKRNN